MELGILALVIFVIYVVWTFTRDARQKRLDEAQNDSRKVAVPFAQALREVDAMVDDLAKRGQLHPEVEAARRRVDEADAKLLEAIRDEQVQAALDEIDAEREANADEATRAIWAAQDELEALEAVVDGAAKEHRQANALLALKGLPPEPEPEAILEGRARVAEMRQRIEEAIRQYEGE